MKTSLITIALLASLAACSAPAENKADAPTEQTTAPAAVIADLGGEQTGPVYTKNKGDTLALSGYDAVSYFTAAAPLEGSADYTVRYQNHEYRFASEENAKAFQKDPAKYVPQYGGYCAWAIGANDALAPGDPSVYKIVDGKLYLNFNKDVAKKWEVDIPGFISKGDVNYPTHKPEERFDS